jgi:hypothetical protein
MWPMGPYGAPSRGPYGAHIGTPMVGPRAPQQIFEKIFVFFKLKHIKHIFQNIFKTYLKRK